MNTSTTKPDSDDRRFTAVVALLLGMFLVTPLVSWLSLPRYSLMWITAGCCGVTPAMMIMDCRGGARQRRFSLTLYIWIAGLMTWLAMIVASSFGIQASSTLADIVLVCACFGVSLIATSLISRVLY